MNGEATTDTLVIQKDPQNACLTQSILAKLLGNTALASPRSGLRCDPMYRRFTGLQVLLLYSTEEE